MKEFNNSVYFNGTDYYMQNIKFPTKGEYKFEIYQAMRDTLLTGIESIGLTIQQNNYGKE